MVGGKHQMLSIIFLLFLGIPNFSKSELIDDDVIINVNSDEDYYLNEAVNYTEEMSDFEGIFLSKGLLPDDTSMILNQFYQIFSKLSESAMRELVRSMTPIFSKMYKCLTTVQQSPLKTATPEGGPASVPKPKSQKADSGLGAAIPCGKLFQMINECLIGKRKDCPNDRDLDHFKSIYKKYCMKT